LLITTIGIRANENTQAYFRYVYEFVIVSPKDSKAAYEISSEHLFCCKSAIES